MQNLALITVLLFVGAEENSREWTDAKGEFKIRAELLTAKDGIVYLKSEEGKLVEFPIKELSQKDREYLRAKTAPAPDVSDHALVRQAHEIMTKACYRCHGEDGTSEGGLNFVLDFDKLRQSYLRPGKPDDSPLFERMVDTDDDLAMPPAGEEPRPTKEEIATIRRWIDAGAPSAQVREKREWIYDQQILESISQDLSQARPRVRRFYRYFSLVHLFNADVSDDELKTYRIALSKLMNSLSWRPRLGRVTPIDQHQVVLRIDLRDFAWSDQTWDSVALANPYAIHYQSKVGRQCYEQTECEMPFVRGDWFVAAASQPPLYHDLLGIPENDRQLEGRLRIDARVNIDQEVIVRAAFNESGVSQNNRMIEWHRTAFGSYWKSYDFAANTGRKNLFDYPLGPYHDESFEHDGGEIIFNLPNGLQGYMLTDENGNRIDSGPTSIVSDPKNPDKSVVNGISCMSCHFAGMIPKKDEMRAFVLANKSLFDDPDPILAIYPDNVRLDQLFQRDGDRFVEKLKQLGITRVTRTNEPVSTIARKFDDSLDASLVAAEFGVPKDDFMKRLDAAQSVGRVLGTVKIPGGTIKREAFVEIYAQAVKDLKVGLVPARSKFLLGTINGDLTRTGLIKVSHRLDKPVHSIAFAPDGVRLAYGQPNTLTFYDFNSEEIIDEVTGIKDYPVISCVSFSPDGRLVAIGGADGRIRIFNVDREGKLSKNVDLEGQAGVVLGMSFDRFSNRLVSCGSDRTLRWWNLADGKPLFLRRFDAPVYDCAFVNKDQAVVATDGKTLQFFEGTSGEQELSKLLDLPGNPLAVTFALEKGQMFITVGKQIYGFRLDNGDQFTSLTAKNVAHHLGVSPDGRWVVAPGNPMNRWDMRNETEHGSFYTKAIKHVVFSPDSLHYVLTDDLARRFSLWQIGNEK